MKAFKKFGFSLLVLLSMVSCRKDQWNDCFQSTGKDITETRAIGPFSKLKVGEKFDIVLSQDTSQPEEIKITCGEHIIGQITTRVKNNVLIIENRNTCNFMRSYDRKIVIEIRVKYLDDIEIFSASNLSCKDTLHFEFRDLNLKNFGLGDISLKLKTGFLQIRTINSGNVILAGFSNILGASIEEVTQLKAENLVCDDIYIDCHSPLDSYVNARVKLFAKIYNSGNVYYKTVPLKALQLVEQRGSGQLLKQ